MATPEADGVDQSIGLLRSGIKRAILIPEQVSPEVLFNAIDVGVAAIDDANSELPPEEQADHVTVIVIFPKGVPGEELLPLILNTPE